MPEGSKPRLSTENTVDKQVIQSFDLLCTECTCIRVLQAMAMKSVEIQQRPCSTNQTNNLHLPGI
jgi:hypothetical protein